MGRSGKLDRNRVPPDDNVAIADDPAVLLEHAEPARLQLGVPAPRHDLPGVDRPLVAVRGAIERDDGVRIALAQLPENGQ